MGAKGYKNGFELTLLPYRLDEPQAGREMLCLRGMRIAHLSLRLSEMITERITISELHFTITIENSTIVMDMYFYVT